jgi:hypothetical protein
VTETAEPADTAATDASTETPAERILPVEPPRAGDLTVGWRIVVAALWIGVTVSFAAVWSASAQLGLATWWLGPRSDPQPQVVRLLPFVVPVLMTIATFNNVRRLAILGIGASLATAGFGIGDLGRVDELAVLELLVAAVALVVSCASLTGTYRRAPGRAAEPDGRPPGRRR